MIDLNFNYPALPEQAGLLRQALRDIAGSGDIDALLRYQPHAGRPRDRAVIAEHLSSRGFAARPERVLIVNGAQHGLAVTLTAALNPGDVYGGLGNCGKGHRRPSVYACLRQQGHQGQRACRARARSSRPARVRRVITRLPFRYERAGRDRHGVQVSGDTGARDPATMRSRHSRRGASKVVPQGALPPGPGRGRAPRLPGSPAMSAGTEAGRRRRRRARVTPMPPVPVEFTGGRAGEGPLTTGQLSHYNWLSREPDHTHAMLRVELPVPAVVSVDDVAGAAAVLIARHESLRTSYLPGEPPRQRVAASGVQLLEVCSLGGGQWGPGDRAAAAAALIEWLRESPGPGQCPVRLAVAIAPGAGERVIACAGAFSHLAVDHGSIEVLKRDFAGLLGDPARRPAGPSGRQPLDQAELEATQAERQRAEAALDYLQEQTRRLPRCLYAVPGARPTGEALAVELSSAAAAISVRRLAARTRASRSSVVLAAVCAVIARRAGYPDLVFPLLSGNRFEPRLVNYVGALVQSTVATVEVSGRSFDELVRHTWTTVMEASRHARHDPDRRLAMDTLIRRERGLLINYAPFFNNLAPESWSGLTGGVALKPEEIDVALAQTELRWRPMPDGSIGTETPLGFRLNQADGCLQLDAWSSDTGLLPRAELESALLAVERLLVAAARGDVPGSRMAALIGLEPLTGTPHRILVDHCWVDVADVQRLVDDAVAPAVARVFASAGGRPLTACLTATGAVRTAEQAHARCMAALARHPTAVTPRHYVICRTAPPDPADAAAWSAPLAAGTGRA